MKQFSFLNMLKVRLGYGETGNSGIGRYNSIVQLGTGGFYLGPNGKWVQTYGPTSNPNPELKWEKKKELNFGIDFGFLNNRIGGTIDIFNRKTSNLLEWYNTQQPPFIFNDIYTNVGEVSSKGIEVTLNTIPVITKDFMWKANFTASHTNNVLESFSNQLYTVDYKEYGDIGGYGALGNSIRTYAGDKIGNFYGKRFAGFSETGEWLFYNKSGEKVHGTENVHPTVSSTGRLGYEYYNKLGYVPYDVKINENAARTLEYAYDDWCIYKLAKELKRPKKEIELFAKRAMNYKNLFDKETKLMRGKNADGKFMTPFSPLKWGDAFTEGNSWHYTWSVFHVYQS